MPQTELEFNPGDIVRLTAAIDGNATDVSWRWVPPAGSSAPASTTNALEWTAGANDAGVYDVEVTSPTASDSPGYGVIRLDVSTVDTDATAYIAAVEAADGQALEAAVKSAINTFVKALKATTGWAAMVNFLPLVGARTLAGALVPLKGVAPTMQNWTAGDYSRTAGITGDFLTKAGTVPLVLSRDDNHHSAYYSGDVFWGAGLVGSVVDPASGETGPGYYFSLSEVTFYNWGEATGEKLADYSGGFIGTGRSSRSSAERWYTDVVPLNSIFTNWLSTPPPGSLMGIMSRWNVSMGGLEFFMSGTCCCYSHGTYYDQPMEVRAAINTYLAALQAALPGK
jgi:hypothetical protein